ncbi:MAG: NAD(P)-binding protein [Thermodesulfobacteriota bacterium]
MIGGGIAGLTAALKLAGQGVAVELTEKSPFLGGYGITYSCKATDECAACGACTVEQTLAKVLEAPAVTIHPRAALVSVKKNKDAFTAKVKIAPEIIDPEKCTGCGACYEKLKGTGAVLRAFSPLAGPLFAADAEVLKKAPALKDPLAASCPEGAIRTDAAEKTQTIKADAVIVATGFAPFNACRKPTYNYKVIPNVITGMDLENSLRENGRLLRPSDGRPVRKAAFIQCVGSRDFRLENPWCSQVCCAYALRSAMAAKHKDSELHVTVFYMDIQTVGKKFPEFYEKCRGALRFVRSIPTDIYPLEEGRARIVYADPETGKLAEDDYDLVALSVGITPPAENKDMAGLLEVGLSADGFFASGNGPARTISTREGVFLAGTAEGPRSILDSAAHAGAAAADVLRHIRALS